MVKTIDTVIPDVYNTLETREHSGDLQSIADTVGKEVSEALVDAMTPRDKKTGLRMSSIGRCERAQWYNIKGYESEPLTGEVFLTFLQGHVLEAVLLGLVELAGHEVTGKQKKHEVSGVKGSQDCYIDGELVDVKTASAWSWEKKFKEDGIKGDAFGYIKQLSGYGKTEDRKEGYFLALNKNKSTLKLCKQELETDIDTYIVDLKEKMELDTPPMRIAKATSISKEGEERLNMDCAFCGFKDECYDHKLVSKPAGKITAYYVDNQGGDF